MISRRSFLTLLGITPVVPAIAMLPANGYAQGGLVSGCTALIGEIGPELTNIPLQTMRAEVVKDFRMGPAIWSDTIIRVGNGFAAGTREYLLEQAEAELARLKLLDADVESDIEERIAELRRFIWDADPEARGGPAFDNADDLIEYLDDSA